MKLLFRSLALALSLALAACGSSSPAIDGQTPDVPAVEYGPETITEHGYITLSDGTRLRYHMERALNAPPGPVVLQYDGYDAGTGGYFSNIRA